MHPLCPKCHRALDVHSKGDWYCKVCFKKWFTYAGTLIDRATLEQISREGDRTWRSD